MVTKTLFVFQKPSQMKPQKLKTEKSFMTSSERLKGIREKLETDRVFDAAFFLQCRVSLNFVP